MSDETRPEQGARTQRPRSPRVPVDFTVELDGVSADGVPFHVQAAAVKVSRGGATLITDAPLKMGASVRLTPPFGRSLEAEVNGVWTDEVDGKQRVGIKLLEPHGWFAE
ncbi:MAG: PilZ domain-containing protein [Pyrinomonadaceae bacterium]|nr:PilZ domain-containing protein [Pyrinomonadaceae bacterium]